MIGKLVFRLPEERVEFELAQNAVKFSAFLEEYSSKLSRRYKHTEPKSEEAYAEYQAIKDEFFEMMENEGINKILWE